MNQTESNRELAETVFRAMNTRDFNELELAVTDNVSFDFPGTGRTEGKRRTLLLLKTLLRKFPKLNFTVSDIVVEGNRACTVWTNEGTDGLGKPYNNSGITLMHFADGNITFISDYFKDTSFTVS